jgi:hypothetical protein
MIAGSVPYTTEESGWGRLRRYGFVSFDVLTRDE